MAASAATATTGAAAAAKPKFATLRWPAAAVDGDAGAALTGTYLVRDLINAPAEHMGPAELEAAAARLAAAHDGATCDSVVGDDLLAANYPQV